MKRKICRVVWFVLAFALVLSAMGCVNTDSDNNSSKESSNNTSSSQVSQSTQTLSGKYDFNDNGILEEVKVVEIESQFWTISVVEDGEEIWSDEASSSHAGWNSIFAVKKDGKDYLLRYTPYMSMGLADYKYKIFSLDKNGEEISEEEGELAFDLNFDSDMHWGFDPKEIADFLTKMDSKLADSVVLISTEKGEFVSDVSGVTFDGDEFWEDSEYDKGKSLEENLRLYQERLSNIE